MAEESPPTPQRPFTAQSRLPVSSRPHTGSAGPLDLSTQSSASGSVLSPPATRPQTSPETKYEWLERRLVRPFNQELVKGRLRTKFAIATKPQSSDAGPATHTPRSDRPPTADSQDYDMSLDTSRPAPLPDPAKSSSSSSPSSAAVPSAHVSLIHRVADTKRSAREQQLQQEQAMRHTPPPSGSAPPSSQVTAQGHHHHHHHHQQQQQQLLQPKGSRSRVKPLDSNRQAELSKLVKCQQNAERLNQHRDRSTPGLHLSTDSGFLSRPASDAVLTDYGQEGEMRASAFGVARLAGV